MFIGLVLGGLLAPISWRMVFLISVPVGLFGTVWAYLKLRELNTPRRSRIDWWGNILFALGLICVMVAVTYGIRPYGGRATGWGSPRVLVVLFAAFLGFNPIQHLVGAHALTALSAHSQAVLTGRSLFPQLISAPFRDGLHAAFGFAVAACLVAAAASLARGGRKLGEVGAVGAEHQVGAVAGRSS